LQTACGDLDAAARWAAVVDDPYWGPVSAARVAMQVGRRDKTSELLDIAVARSPRHLVTLHLLRARAAADRDESAAWTERAITDARANGMLQTVASAQALDLLERFATDVPKDWMDRLRRASAAGQPSVRPELTYPVEPLTSRERDVLRFLASRLSITEIADELHISKNTLKFHLKIIYRKLGAHSRAEAAAHARSWSASIQQH